MPKVSGEENLDLPVAEVWRLLTDPDALAAAIPGCKGFAAQPGSEHTYQTALTVAVGPVTGVYEGTVEYRDIEAPNACTITVDGTGDHGTITGSGKIVLAEAGDAATTVAYDGNFKITGAVAAVGQRIAPGVSRKIIVETLRNLALAGQSGAATASARASDIGGSPPAGGVELGVPADRPLSRAHGPEPSSAPLPWSTEGATGGGEGFHPFALSPWAAYCAGVVSGVAAALVATAVL